jgi:hypothetical protein
MSVFGQPLSSRVRQRLRFGSKRHCLEFSSREKRPLQRQALRGNSFFNSTYHRSNTELDLTTNKKESLLKMSTGVGMRFVEILACVWALNKDHS